MQRWESREYATAAMMEAEAMFVPGELYSYVAVSLLNGIVNYVKPVAAYVIDRYWEGTWTDKVNHVASCNRFPGHHTKFSVYEDDVLLLAETESWWWFLDFDGDVSDCSIGRLPKQNRFPEITESMELSRSDMLPGVTREVLVAEFRDYAMSRCETRDGNRNPALEIPVGAIRGWVSF